MYENGTNVGMGMAPHRKGCRCDECEIDRLREVERKYRDLEEKRVELNAEIGERDDQITALQAKVHLCVGCDKMRKALERINKMPNRRGATGDAEKGYAEALQDCKAIAGAALQGIPDDEFFEDAVRGERSKWVDIEAQKPKVGRGVLVWSPGNITHYMAYWDGKRWRPWVLGECERQQITQWRPLPDEGPHQE